MDTELTFGTYLREKRGNQFSARELAIKAQMSAMYICDIEKHRRPAPTDELLERLADALKITDAEERAIFYDLAAKSKNTVSLDLPDYIMEKDIVRAALRTAKECDATDSEWEEFIERIKKRTDKGE